MESKALPGAAPARDRFGVWINKIEQGFQVKTDLLDRPPARFSGGFVKHEIGRMTMFGVSGTSYAASHARQGNPDYVSVLMAMRGSTHVVQDSFDRVLNPGEYCILDSVTSSVTTIPAPFHNVVVRFPASDVTMVLPSWEQSIGVVIHGRSGVGAMFYEFIRSMMRQVEALEPESHSGISNAAVDLFGSTLLALPHNRKPAPAHMENFHRTRIYAFVRENLRDPELDVDMVAVRLGLSPRHVHRLFKSEPQHLMHWVWSERLRHSYAELSRASQRHRTVAQIAYAWGFNDSAHFSRAFRQRFGIAPSEVRDRVLHG